VETALVGKAVPQQALDEVTVSTIFTGIAVFAAAAFAAVAARLSAPPLVHLLSPPRLLPGLLGAAVAAAASLHLKFPRPAD
jgi:hypothetical protein